MPASPRRRHLRPQGTGVATVSDATASGATVSAATASVPKAVTGVVALVTVAGLVGVGAAPSADAAPQGAAVRGRAAPALPPDRAFGSPPVPGARAVRADAVTGAPRGSALAPTALRPTLVRGWSTRTVLARTGTRVLRTATLSGPAGRAVVLQRAAGRQWRTAIRTVTSRRGSVAVRVTAVLGTQRYRLAVPRSGSFAAAVSPVVAVRGLATSTPVTPPGPTPPPTPLAGIDTTDRAAVAAAYRSRYLPLTTVPTAWTGSVPRCDAGSQPATVQQATLAAVNYYRAQAGLPAVVLDAALSARAQQAALVMSANGALSHSPPSSWTCWNATAADAAGHSNLALWGGRGSATLPIDLYMDDSGVPSVGHRSWVLNPSATVIGSGTVDRANALLVIDGRNLGAPPPGTPEAVPWPNAGYVPKPLIPEQYWSVTFPGASASALSGAAVSAQGPSGPIAVTGLHTVSGYGRGTTLVWTMPSGAVPAGAADVAVTVRVTGPRPLTYTVTAFAP